MSGGAWLFLVGQVIYLVNFQTLVFMNFAKNH